MACCQAISFKFNCCILGEVGKKPGKYKVRKCNKLEIVRLTGSSLTLHKKRTVTGKGDCLVGLSTKQAVSTREIASVRHHPGWLGYLMITANLESSMQ